MRFSSEVLPVMRIIALSFVVLFVERTPLSFEIEHVEICILLHEMDNPCFYVPLWVSERTKFSIFTVRQMFWELCAKLCLVFLYVVESFHSVMGQSTSILVRASVSLGELAQLRTIELFFPSPIFNWVIILAVLMIVLLSNGAWFYFEELNIQVFDCFIMVLVHDLENRPFSSSLKRQKFLGIRFLCMLIWISHEWFSMVLRMELRCFILNLEILTLRLLVGTLQSDKWLRMDI